MPNILKCERCGAEFDPNDLKTLPGCDKGPKYWCQTLEGYDKDNDPIYHTVNLCEECLDQLTFWLDFQPIYICDPTKNNDCKKTGCYITNGPCQMTTDKESAGGI